MKTRSGTPNKSGAKEIPLIDCKIPLRRSKRSATTPFHVFFLFLESNTQWCFFVLPIEERNILFLIIVKLTKKRTVRWNILWDKKRSLSVKHMALRFLLHHKNITTCKITTKSLFEEIQFKHTQTQIAFSMVQKKKKNPCNLTSIIIIYPWCCYTIFLFIIST